VHTISDQTGKRFVVTDIAASTGREATKRIKVVGVTVLIAVRTPSKGAAVKAEILLDHPSAAPSGPNSRSSRSPAPAEQGAATAAWLWRVAGRPTDAKLVSPG
jgi:hypothetical protein